MTQDTPRAFGDLLRRHRVFAGMSQEELAARASLSARAISDLERGVKRVPRRDTLQLLIEALNLSGESQAAFVAAAREPAIRSSATRPSAKPADQSEAPAEARAPASGGWPGALPQARTPAAKPPVGGFLGAVPQGALVGRETEYEAILAALSVVTEGAGRLVVVTGEPGVGKTRLTQEAMLACQERGVLVATGRCYEPHRAVPYYPFLEALSGLYAVAPEAPRQELPARWPALLQLLPGQPNATPPALSASPQEEQQRLFWAVTGFAQAVSEVAPVALLLDDLQWVDDASLALLQHLARHTRTHGILLLGTYRDIEVGRQHPLGRALYDLEREHLVERVAVRRLGHDETARLVAERMGQGVSEEFTDLVHRHTDGNPLFVQEVLRTLIERGDVYRREGQWERKEITAIEVPESVRATIADRVARLGELAQDALREASILGQAFGFEDLLAMGGRAEDALDAALEEALAAGLVQETRDGYIFNHALTQQALYTELSSRRRRRLHLAAGEALERLPERARQPRAAELAWHLREGGAPERALTYALLAGDHARSLYATGEAERHYRAALALAESLDDHAGRARALEKLGWLMWLLARFDASAELLGRSADEFQALGDVEGEMRAVGLLGMLYFTAEPLEGVRRITALLDRLGRREPSKPLASLYTSLAMNLLIAGRYQETVDAATRGAEVARVLGDERMLVWAETTRGPALGMMGRLDEARRASEAAIPMAETANDYFGLLSAVHHLGAMCVAEGNFAAALEYYGRALELAERLGARSRISAETANLAEVRFYLGEWTQARELAERALEIARAESAGQRFPYFQYANVFRQVGMIRAAMGEWEDALPLARESVALAERLPYPEAVRASQGLLAEHDLVAGDPEAVLARLQPLAEGAHAEELGAARLLPLLAWARAEQGASGGAERMLAAGIARAREQGHRLALVDLLRARGRLLSRQERWAEAQHTLDEAVALARSMTYSYAEGRALYEQGRACGGARAWRAARERFQEARAIFRRLGAGPDAERAEHALVECGPD